VAARDEDKRGQAAALKERKDMLLVHVRAWSLLAGMLRVPATVLDSMFAQCNLRWRTDTKRSYMETLLDLIL
jgi:hypothetical protein